MCRHVQDARIAVEDLLRPVAVVNVDVDDRNPLEPTREHRGRRNRDIVEEAETHRTIGFSVMSRRTQERECGLSFGDRVLGGLYGCSCGEQRDLVRVWRRERVGIEHDRLAGGRSDPLHVRCGMDAPQLVQRRASGGRYAAATRLPAIGDGIENVGSFDALRMARRVPVAREKRRGAIISMPTSIVESDAAGVQPKPPAAQ